MKVKLQGIGGIIDPVEYEFVKGVNVFRAPNAWGKTSLAKGLLSVMTSTIKAEDLINVNSDRSYVQVEIDGKRYYRKIVVRGKGGKILEESKLMLDDPRALLLGYFSPENPLVSRILAGEEDVTWFITEVGEISKLKAKKSELENEKTNLLRDLEFLKASYSRVKEIKSKLEKIYVEIEELKKSKDFLSKKILESIEISKKNRADVLRSRLEVKRERYAMLVNRLNKLREELNKINQELATEGVASITEKLERINAELREISAKRGEIEGRLKSLEFLGEKVKEAEKAHTDHCPLCGTKVDPESWRRRLQSITEELKGLGDALRSLAIEEAELNTKKREFEALLKESQKKLERKSAIESEIAKIEKELNELDYQIKDLEIQIKSNDEKTSKELTMVLTSDKAVENRLKELEEQRKSLEFELQEYPPETTILEEIQRKSARLKEVDKELAEVEQNLTRNITVAVSSFQTELSELLSKLGFSFTAKIEVVNDKMLLKVYKGNTELGVKRLSTSEKTALALALIASAAKAFFAPPIMLLDETVMAFDETRFRQLVDYLTRFSKYIIITRADTNLSLESQMVPMAQQA